MNNITETDFIKFWFENGILISSFKDDTVLDLEKIKVAITIREQISEGKNQFWLYDISNLNNINKEVRDYADKYGQDYLNGIAVLINSHITRFMFNTYLRLNRPKIPFLFFSNKEKAFEWLLKLKENN